MSKLLTLTSIIFVIIIISALLLQSIKIEELKTKLLKAKQVTKMVIGCKDIRRACYKLECRK